MFHEVSEKMGETRQDLQNITVIERLKLKLGTLKPLVTWISDD